MSDAAPRRDHCSEHPAFDPSCDGCKAWERNPRPDRRGRPPLDKAEAHRQLREIISAARAIDEHYDTLHDAAYSRGVFGDSGGSGASDGTGSAFIASQSVRDRLMEVCEHVPMALAAIAGALKARDRALDNIDKAHPLYLDHRDADFDVSVTRDELLRLLEASLRSQKAELPHIVSLEARISKLRSELASERRREAERSRRQAVSEGRAPRDGRTKGWKR